MKLLLDIKDDKSLFIMELLGNFDFVRVKDVSTPSTQILEDISEGVEELKLIETGKQQAIPFNAFLREL